MTVDDAYEIVDIIDECIFNLRRLRAVPNEHIDETELEDLLSTLEKEKQRYLEYIGHEKELDDAALSAEYERDAL